MVQCEAPKIAKLVNITPITMVYGTQITIVTGAYKPPLMVLLLYHVLPTSSLIQICEKVIDPNAAAPHTTRACEKRF